MIFNNMYDVELTSSNYNPSADTSITITATCKDYNDNPVSGRSLTIKKNGTSIYTGTTDSNGQISTATTCGMSGAVNFSVKHFNMVINVNPYPVGSIYISYTQSQSPSALFGGTWAQITSGFLYASTTADDVTSPPSGQGEATHTLTIDEMPAHDHTFNRYQNDGSTTNYSAGWTNQKCKSQATSSKGGGQAHNNMPPYIKVYMWKRTG